MKTCLLVFIAAAAFAASPFDGTWKLDLGSAQLPSKPITFTTVNGVYSCSSCVPPITGLKADGTDQPVTGHPEFDQESVRAVNAATLQVTEKKAGKVVDTQERSVDETGKRLTMKMMFYPPNAKPFQETLTATRVENGPPGSHATSGSWREDKIEAPASALLRTYKMTGDQMSMTSSVGESYTAMFDGKDYPLKGGPGADTVSLKRIGANTLEETIKSGGKVTQVVSLTVSADGHSMTLIGENKVQGTTAKIMAVKQ